MRDILLILVVFGALPFILWRPPIGILVWSWLGYMNPHRLAWGFAYSFPFAQFVGLTTIIGMLFYKDRGRLPINGLTVLLIVFIFWMTLSTLFSLNPERAWPEWDRAMKIQLISFLTILLMQDERLVKQLVWVIALSLGFFGIKGGIFSIVTAGEYRVLGPPDSFIGDNNSLALALLMVVPLMRFCQLDATNKWIKRAWTGGLVLTCISILISHSRGALVGAIATLMFAWWKSRRKMFGILLGLAMIPLVFAFLPEHWFDRMSTIAEYKEDPSALGRINAWWFAFNLAVDRPLVGGGFRTFTHDLFLKYAPVPDDHHDAHSIYFEVLAEHGFVGLGLFLGIGVLALLQAGRIARLTPSDQRVEWIPRLAALLQVSLVSYAVTGAFLGLAYFDLYYQIVAILIVLNVLARRNIIRLSGVANVQSSELAKPAERNVDNSAVQTIARVQSRSSGP
jgi:probable O-glycosylation ligase (exosortase A-associated)